jgi:hypothetical protein
MQKKEVVLFVTSFAVGVEGPGFLVQGDSTIGSGELEDRLITDGSEWGVTQSAVW